MPAQKNRRHRQQKTNKMTVAKRLPKMARHCLASGDDQAYQRLMDLLAKQMSAGNHKVLEEALRNTQGIDEQRLLNAAMEEVVDTLFLSCVSVSDEGYVFSDMTSRLFLIPVIGVIEEGKDQVALDDAQLDAMTKSLRKYGILENETNVMLMGDLFRLEDLPEEHTKAYRFHESLSTEMSASLGLKKAKRQILEHHRVSAFSRDRKPSESTSAALRFLVGVVSGEYPEFPDERVMDNEGGDPQKDLGIRYEEWGAEVREVLSPCFMDRAVSALLPDAYYDAIKEGVFHYNQTAALISFGQAITLNDMDPSHLSVVVGHLDDDNSITVLLKDSQGNQPVESLLWQLPDSYEDTVMRSMGALEAVATHLGTREIRDYDPVQDRPNLKALH